MVVATRYSREEKISGFFISSGELRQISDIIADEYAESTTETKVSRYIDDYLSGYLPGPSEYAKEAAKSRVFSRIVKRYHLEGDDGTTYESDEESIFQIAGVMDTKRIVYIRVEFENRYEDKEIRVVIKHTKEQSSSSIEVSGTNETWTKGVTQQIEDVIAGCKKQYMFPWLHQAAVFTGILVFGVWLLRNVAFLLTQILYSDPNWNDTSELQAWILLGMPMMVPAYLVLEKMKKLFPSVEIVSGPAHMRIQERQREVVIMVILYIVVPLLLSIVTSVLL